MTESPTPHLDIAIIIEALLEDAELPARDAMRILRVVWTAPLEPEPPLTSSGWAAKLDISAGQAAEIMKWLVAHGWAVASPAVSSSRRLAWGYALALPTTPKVDVLDLMERSALDEVSSSVPFDPPLDPSLTDEQVREEIRGAVSSMLERAADAVDAG